MDITLECDYIHVERGHGGKALSINVEEVEDSNIIEGIETDVIVDNIDIGDLLTSMIEKGHTSGILEALIEHGEENAMEQALIENGYEFTHDE